MIHRLNEGNDHHDPATAHDCVTAGRLLQFATLIVAVVMVPASAVDVPNPSPNPPAEWITKAEATDFVETPRYDEVVAYCRRLAAESPWVHMTSCGKSPEGRDMVLMVLSKERAFTPADARETDKLVVFINNGIHSGEIEGKDASLMLMRDIAMTRTRESLLDHAIILMMPIFSVDAHERFSPYNRINQNGPKEMGWRVTSQYYNLNRDFTKADAPEMHAWLSVWNAWNPDLHFDNHTSDGGDWQYDLTFDTASGVETAPQISDWVNQTLYPKLFPDLEADGHLPFIYFDFVDGLDPAKGISSGGFGTRFSTGYVAARNRASILVETHMLKDYRTRVFGHYNIMKRVLENINANPQALREANRAADRETIEWGKSYDPERKYTLTVKQSETSRKIQFKGVEYKRVLSEVSGSMWIIYDPTKPYEFEIPYLDATESVKTVAPPLGYLIPPQWTAAIERVSRHGLRAERLLQPVTAEFESYQFENITFSAVPFEGHHAATYEAKPIKETRTYLAGSVFVPLDQANAKVAVHLFEPDSQDSLMAWGFFNTITEQKEYGEHYVVEKLAREMLANDPALKAEFEEKVRTDPAFAGSAEKRLDFFYRKSPWWDARLNVYPIARVTQKPDWKTEPM